jgi:hypothetical protein
VLPNVSGACHNIHTANAAHVYDLICDRRDSLCTSRASFLDLNLCGHDLDSPVGHSSYTLNMREPSPTGWPCTDAYIYVWLNCTHECTYLGNCSIRSSLRLGMRILQRLCLYHCITA